MRFPILITTSLVLGALCVAPGAQAAPSGTAYDVTVTGILEWEKTHVDIPSTRPRECFDTKGTEVDRTKAAWKSQAPLRVKIIKREGRFELYPIGRGGGRAGDWDLRVNMIHSGSSDRQVKARDCESWVPLPPPEEENCIKTLTDWGGNVGPKTVRKNGTIEFTGREVFPSGNPFDGCPWGDHSLGLYSSKGKINPQVILNSVASEVWLKGKDETKSGVPGGDTTTTVRTTSVRLLFKRVKPKGAQR